MMDTSRANALVVLEKHRKKKNLLRRSYFKRVKCARQNYKPEDVLAAMHAIWRGMSRRQAAKVFNIPRSTLLDKLDGKRPVDASPGPNPFLTKAEERTLEAWAIDLYRRGFPLKTEDLKDVAQAIIQNSQRRTSFKNGRPGRSWMRNFLIRHPRVYEISADMAPGPRRSRTVTTREELRTWCQYHRQFMVSIGHENILDSPDRVFNVDHGEFLFDKTSGLLVEQERSEKPEEKDREKLEQSDELSAGVECVSVITTFTASGRMAPVMLVSPNKEAPVEDCDSLPQGWIKAHSENGSITGKIFLDYVIAFRKWLEQESVTLPVLLLVDGRRSRLNVDVTRYCEEHSIILYCLFPTSRPAISELFSSVLHDSLNTINRQNFGLKLNEGLGTWTNSHASETPTGNKILPHLQSMLQTLAEVRAEPLESLPSAGFPPEDDDFVSQEVKAADEYESDCEFDDELTPVEGEIVIEFPASELCDPFVLAQHPALLADSDVPRFLVCNSYSNVLESPHAPHPPEQIVDISNPSSGFLATVENDNECIEDRVDQPDVTGHLIVKPLSSPLPETTNGIAKVESEIKDVLDSIMSLGTVQVKSELQLPQDSADKITTEEPFLGFSPDEAPIQQNTLDAHGCLRFLETYLGKKGFLNEFKAAQSDRHWTGSSEAESLFDVWLAASDQCSK